jgi:UDP-N-acetylmuramoyl-tripeptide--D-alanyl-D-alanine ligase
MEEAIKIAIIIFWFPQTIAQLLNWTYWWQVKEYRFDRFRLLLGSRDGRRNLGILKVSLKLFVILQSIFFPHLVSLFIIYQIIQPDPIYIDLIILSYLFSNLLLPLITFSMLDISYVFKLVNKNFRKPVFTQRAKRIVATGVLFSVLFVTVILFTRDYRHSLLFGELSLLASPYIGILLTIPSVNKAKKEDIEKARKRLKKVKPTVIGITGSYGKSSTKEFVSHLLAKRYKTAKTTGSENTEFGVARKTVKYVKKDTKFFVVEMGAYKKGEVKRLVDIVRPNVGIITGIEPQHLSLFGSIDQIMKTKYELVEGLSKGGIAIFNLSNNYCRKLYQKAKKDRPDLTLLSYGLNVKNAADISATVVSESDKGVAFEIKQDGVQKKMLSPIQGGHLVENLLAAILISRMFKIPWEDISLSCNNVKLQDKTMQVIKTKKGYTVVDDSYNSTPTGFKAALKHISSYKGKKLVITPGIIELRELSGQIHKNIASDMVKVGVDNLILTNNDFFKYFKSNPKLENKIDLITKRKDIKKIKKYLKKGSVILVEGRVPKFVSDYLGI